MDHEGYPMPSGVRMQADIAVGYGVRELVQTLIATGIAIGVAIFIYLYFGNMIVCVGLVIAVAVLSIGILMRDDNNQSIAFFVGNMFRYFRSARMYPYRYLDEWEAEEGTWPDQGRRGRVEKRTRRRS